VFIWYILSGLGITYQEKSGNPDLESISLRIKMKKASESFIFFQYALFKGSLPPGLPDFSWYNIPKRKKIPK
jgi:hypothetical protein